MQFISTRNTQNRYSLSEAIKLGLAQDGGLFVPEHIPHLDIKQFTADLSYADFSAQLLHAFFKADVLDHHLSAMCQQAFTFPLPLININPNTFILELFHGPTLSFKDVGARFLAECLNTLSEQQKLTILVATSGDTGSAVASAFYQKANINVIILYPFGKISKKQEHQITCWNDNICALAINGNFDDCQRLVKAAFADSWWQSHLKLSSANSINIGRLLPQMTYYAYSSMQFYHAHQQKIGYVIPTGNLGNATAAYIAKLIGFPIREIVIATNANKTIVDYLATGVFKPHATIHTLANAMDVGNPSNFERLHYLFPSFASFKKEVKAFSASDADITATIKSYYENYDRILCPHTATAAYVRTKLSEEPWVVVATADPCKFDEVIEPIIHHQVPMAPAMKAMLDKHNTIIEVNPTLDEIRDVVQEML